MVRAIHFSRFKTEDAPRRSGRFGDSTLMETTSREKTILDRIVAARRESIARRKRSLPDAALKFAVEKAEPPRDFPGALARDGYNVIAELKKASPSRGILRQEYAPAFLAASLERAGAAALSVLTEEEFFLGSLGDLKQAKKAAQIPILRKDFIIDPWQIWEARAAGSDSFLLIVAILEDATLRELLEIGRSLKMEPLVEVHSSEELRRAISAEARIIGVNNRNLRDFKVRTEISLELIEAIPEECIAVSESGLRTHADLDRLRNAGFDAFLVGEHLMKEADPAAPLRELIGLTGDGDTNHAG
jgi:indole-3-glycerol phosphate synthase